MIEWLEARTLVALLALAVSVLALVMARRDKQSEAQKNALKRIEDNFNVRVDTERRVVDERHTAVVGHQGEMTVRLASIEENLKHLPTRRDLDGLQTTISTIAQAVARQQGALESNTRMVERMNSFLMEKGT